MLIESLGIRGASVKADRREGIMPVITAHILKGRSVESKRRLVSALTAAMADTIDVEPKSIHVLIEEYDSENWSVGGELFADGKAAPVADEIDLDALFRKPAPQKEKSKPAAKAPPRKAPAKSRSRR
jgi:4-oxalocrotonate tautomerase